MHMPLSPGPVTCHTWGFVQSARLSAFSERLAFQTHRVVLVKGSADRTPRWHIKPLVLPTAYRTEAKFLCVVCMAFPATVWAPVSSNFQTEEAWVLPWCFLPGQAFPSPQPLTCFGPPDTLPWPKGGSCHCPKQARVCLAAFGTGLA